MVESGNESVTSFKKQDLSCSKFVVNTYICTTKKHYYHAGQVRCIWLLKSSKFRK
jgi:hypothetical protein